MSGDPKADHTLALIAALQTILDKLPDSDDGADEDTQQSVDLRPTRDPTHELFVTSLDQGTLAGLFTSIRIIHSIHNANR